MGGGNGQKSFTAKQRKAGEKQKAAKAAQRNDPKNKALAQANKEAFKCKGCMQPFPSTTKDTDLKAHIESKHSKLPALGKKATTEEKMKFCFGK